MFEHRKISALSRAARSLVLLLLVASFLGVVEIGAAQSIPSQPTNKARTVVGGASSAAGSLNSSVVPSNPILTIGNIIGSGPSTSAGMPRMRGTTNKQRMAAAAHNAISRAKSHSMAGRSKGLNAKSNAIVGLPSAPGIMPDLGQFYFSGLYPNYANSPLPNVNDAVNCPLANHCGIRKFVDQLSVPGGTPTPTLKQTIPIAVPDTTTFPGSDYYEIELGQYTEQLHSDLPKTMLRGYRQTNITPAMDFHYLGPLIIATGGDVAHARPVRIKFTNKLGSVTDPNFLTTGKLFVPEDNSVLGAGLGLAKGESPYLDNRATIHLHGGNTPWISDGTPHQWTVPASDISTSLTLYPRGDSVQFVPDMWFDATGKVLAQCGSPVLPALATCANPDNSNMAALKQAGYSNDSGPGTLTFYYTNQQSARLMFYHDHSYGTTRLNVYIGEAGGYLIQDQAELDLINGTNTSGIFAATPPPSIPAIEIPLIIQDKTFVPPTFAGGTSVYSVPLLQSGQGYTQAATSIVFSGTSCATLPAATPTVGLAIDPFGQYIYGAVTGITITNWGSGCTSAPTVAIVGDGTGAAAFASLATLSQQDPTWDMTLWGGQGNLWYPHVYMPNQWPNNPDGSGSNPMGRWDYAAWFWPAFTNQYQVSNPIVCTNPLDLTPDVCPGTPTPMNPGPANALAVGGGGVHLGKGSIASLTPEAFMDTAMVNGTVYPTLTVDPQAYRFRVLSVGNDRSLNLSWFVACGTSGYTPSAQAMPCPVPTVPGIAVGTEVGMVPASPTAGYPLWWPTDGRDGGVPDPASSGPAWYAIGNEGGVLPAPTVIPAAPVNYEYDRRSVTITNTSTISLNLMPAERADVIVDFTAFAGKTLILYNDAPAPYPAFDTRYDYYTGDPDQSGAGGAPTTLAGFGPNTRTIMQVKVNPSVTGPATSFNPTALATYLPVVFKATQPVPIVPEPAYSAIYAPKATPFKPIMPTLGANTLTFTPIGAAAPLTLTFGQKAIQELFELDYGRMNATLGTEIQLTTYNNQTTIPLGYADPFTDDIYDSSNVSAQPVGVAGDGTQIWEVIHNGVDSHAIHFHLYNVQIIDRVGWDGTLRAPFPNELGWKDTVRMNPLEIDFVALRPMKMTLPFPVPDSTRLLDVTQPPGKDLALTPFTPTNAASTQMNSVVTMGWEYVWHCHILGHEENDMMREQTFQVPPETPVSVVASVPVGTNAVTVTFTDKSLSETGFTVQRADDVNFLNGVVAFKVDGAAPNYNTTVTYVDNTPVAGQTYYYRIQAFKPDADYWAANVATPLNLPNLVSAWSAVAQTGAAPVLTVNPATLLPFGSLLVGTISTPQTVILSNPGPGTLTVGSITFAGANPADFTQTNNCGVAILSPVTCTITVTFTPTAMGARAGNLTFTTTDPLNPQINIPLSGVGISPALVLSPVALTFGNQQVGSVSPTPLVVTISNSTGTAPLAIGSLVLSGINAAEFTMTQTCGTTLAMGASCSASFTFAPTATGTRSATLTVPATAPAVSQSVAISGTGTAPVATLAPTALSFLSQLVNSTSTAQTVTLANTGLAPLSITSIAFAGTNPGDFTQSATTCSLTLASGANCTIQVAFRPLARGVRTGTLVVTDNALAPAIQTVSLSGTGIAPVATILPASLAFGVQVIATTSAPQTMVLFNGGDVSLLIGSMSVSGANASDFSSTPGTCGPVLPVLSSCALSVSFTPAVSGPRTGVLAIATSDPITPVLTVPLSGTGTAVSLSPAAITFASLTVGTSSTSWTVTLTNAGTSALNISSIVLSGTNLADFTLNNQCGATVASGRSCTVRVRFAPTAIGTRSASLVFTTSDLGTPQASVALSGIGTLPALSASPTTLTFSSPVNQASAVQPVTVSNIGTAPLTITSINMGGTNTGQFNQTNNCTIGTPMAVGASCIVNVTFRPTSTNPLIKSQTLNINVAAPAVSQSIPLTGTVIVPTFTVSPASITFPNQAINTTSATQTTTLTNTGTVPLPLTNVAITGSNRFAQTSTCGASVFRPFPSTLPVGASCTISTTFRPTTATTITSSLTISVGGGATPAQTQIQLTGTGQ